MGADRTLMDAPDLEGRRAEAAEMLLRVAARLRSETTVAGVLDAAFEAFHPLLPFDRLEYATIDGDELVTRWVRAAYPSVLLDVGFRFVPTSEPPSGPWIDIDTAALAGARPEGHPARLLLDEGIRSGLCCPLEAKGDRFGYLFFCSRQPRAYSEFHTWVMSHLADVVAGALALTEAYERVQAHSRTLERLMRSRRDFVSAISHELRTPLTGVLGLARLLAEGEILDEERGEVIEMLVHQAEDAAAIVEDLLVVGLAEGGHLEVTPVPLDAGALASSLAAEVAPQVTVAGTGLVTADPVRSRQVLRNLLTNALKYGGDRIWVEIRQRSDAAEISVCDDGPGVPDSVAEAVFRPYERGGDVETGGHGLGLWVSRLLAERMGGSLSYVRDGSVTCFVLTLPSQVDSATNESVNVTSSDTSATDGTWGITNP